MAFLESVIQHKALGPIGMGRSSTLSGLASVRLQA
jgi:hypothetical protein